MSMLSAQVDELRETADKICELEVIEKINVSWAQRILAPMLRDAADTIWELRNKLAGTIDMRERARLVEVENDKLRELVRIAGTYCANGLCDKDDGCPMYTGNPCCAFSDRMRELGIEVDG